MLPPPESSVYYMDELNKYYPGVVFGNSCAIMNPAYVKIAKSVTINHVSSIAAIIEYAGMTYTPYIEIGEGCQIGAFANIASCNKIIIGKNVLTASYVQITDHNHGYKDITKPIMHQPIESQGPIEIGDGSWIGFGSHILSGVTIGKNVVIGANSVVSRDIPDFSVAVGSPAKVVRQYDGNKKAWCKPGIMRQCIDGLR
ncbi:MAG: acyltransferase [Methanothrix sp.]|nr:acyltransferase [Methanothrix sp.]